MGIIVINNRHNVLLVFCVIEEPQSTLGFQFVPQNGRYNSLIGWIQRYYAISMLQNCVSGL